MANKPVKLVFEGITIEKDSLEEAKESLYAMFPETKNATLLRQEDNLYIVQKLFGSKG